MKASWSFHLLHDSICGCVCVRSCVCVCVCVCLCDGNRKNKKITGEVCEKDGLFTFDLMTNMTFSKHFVLIFLRNYTA